MSTDGNLARSTATYGGSAYGAAQRAVVHAQLPGVVNRWVLPAASPTRAQWHLHEKVPEQVKDLFKRTFAVLRQEQVKPTRLRDLYQLGIHVGGRIGKDASFVPRQRRLKQHSWEDTLRVIAGLILNMDYTSRYVGTPIAGAKDGRPVVNFRSWEDIQSVTYGDASPGVTGHDRLDRISVKLRELQYVVSARINIAVKDEEGQVERYEARPGVKRVTKKLLAKLGLADLWDRAATAMKKKLRREQHQRQRRVPGQTPPMRPATTRGLTPLDQLLDLTKPAAQPPSRNGSPLAAQAPPQGPPGQPHSAAQLSDSVPEHLQQGGSSEDHIAYLTKMLGLKS